MNVFVNNPRGYCVGVIKAISMAMEAKECNPKSSIYIYGELVHNEEVIQSLTSSGIVTLRSDMPYRDTLKSLPKGSILVFTAHGHPQIIEDYARELGLLIIDATCQRVKENLNIAKKTLSEKREIIYIGKAKHPETIAMTSLSRSIYLFENGNDFDYKSIKDKKPLVLNQTTLSFLDLKDIHDSIREHYPNATILDEICDATKLRQESIYKLPDGIDLIYVVGGSHSSNTEKLFEISQKRYPNSRVLRILNADDIKQNDLKGHLNVAVISGASTPIDTTNKIVKYLKSV
ncbi:MAG: 4-hydroxy-3-methylbut-2-enyl diphosphate reductase [Bacilli bacterium]|jgi:4-hydroxy-3-methylbut-2-enyl diphosphate reductase